MFSSIYDQLIKIKIKANKNIRQHKLKWYFKNKKLSCLKI